MMKKFWFIFILFFLKGSLLSQVTYNSYARISNISGTSMTVTNLTEPVSFSFAATGNVLVMQMQDDVIGANTTNASTFGDLGSNQSVGLWEQKTISSINRSGSTATIVLSSALVNNYNTGANSSAQIISFPLLNAAAYSTSANISGTAWTGSVGGVVAFEVGTILTLNNNISANALGFRGGTVSANYYPGGSTCDTIANTWRQGSNIRGQKGEGVYKITNASYQHGKAKILNGGGGGSNINAGGGGGGNWSAGGNGGPGWNGSASGCASPGAAGRGGISLASIIPLNRIFMGGGGGGGQQNNSASTPGGRGGGIVVVKAGTLVTSGTCASPRLISANGATAATSGNDGSGGAGAGGSIILQIGSFNVLSTCQLSITANGANGGTVNTSTHAGGGAGGQGIVVFSINQPTANITTQTNNGNPGCNNNSVPCNNTAGSAGGSNGGGIIPNIGGNLPVDLLNFNAKKLEHHIYISWNTSSETFNDYFTIEKSLNGIDFLPLEIVKTKAKNGNSMSQINYQTLDPSPKPGTTYYRLKQTDQNGNFKIYHAVSVNFDKINPISFAVFPNPNKGEFYIDVSGIEQSHSVELTVIDINGKIVFRNIFETTIQNSLIKIAPKENLLPGVYICNFLSQGINYPIKVIVQ